MKPISKAFLLFASLAVCPLSSLFDTVVTERSAAVLCSTVGFVMSSFGLGVWLSDAGGEHDEAPLVVGLLLQLSAVQMLMKTVALYRRGL